MLVSTGAFGFAAGPVPWIHWRCKSPGISGPSNFPSLASRALIPVRGITDSGSRKPIRSLSRARAALRRIRASIKALRSESNFASAASAALASGVKMSG